MKILFLMRHSGLLRNFESTLRLLCERDHRVHLGFQTQVQWLLDSTDVAQQLSAQYPNFSHGMAPLRKDGWGLLGRRLRLTLDYLRYLTPEYRAAPKLRRRAERGVDNAVVRAAQHGPAIRWCLARVLRVMDRSIPRSPEIDRFIADERPDVVVVTPLIRDGSPQSDYVRSARAQGVRTVLCVASWDNLTNKGLVHERVDLVTVWNEAMKREAVDLHGVPPNRVAVTGAQPFDQWFGRQPSTSREAFCRRVGLGTDQPYLLYLCSSTFVARDEAPFVRTWVQQLRGSSSEALRRVGVLVRPHPQNAAQWRRFDMSGVTNVVIHPPMGAAPVDAASQAEYFDSMCHSAAVVGVNTTAEIESAIVGRQVFTLLAPEFRETQEGTLHFRHLRGVNGGFLHVAESFPEHLAQLDAALRTGGADDGRCRRFVEAFVRPYGIDVPATQKLVEALEGLGERPAPRPERPPLWAPLVRPLIGPLAARARREATAAAAEKARRLKAKGKQRALLALKRNARAQVRARTPRKAPHLDTPATDVVPAPPAAPPASAEVPHKLGKRARGLADLVQAFQALPYGDRFRFVRANVEHIPAEL